MRVRGSRAKGRERGLRKGFSGVGRQRWYVAEEDKTRKEKRKRRRKLMNE